MIGPEVTAPDLTEAVVGFRTFNLMQSGLHNYNLCSPYQQSEVWTTATKTARCLVEVKVPEGIVLPGPVKPHSAPQKNCGCGIYAYFDPCPVREEPDNHHWSSWTSSPALEVAALMTMTGRIETHARGMRAQHATICALGTHNRMSPDHAAAVHAIAEQLGVAVVHQSKLPELATEYGRPLRDDMKPEATETSSALTFSGTTVTFSDLRTSEPYRPHWSSVGINAGIAAPQIVAGFLVSPGFFVGALIATAAAAYWHGRRHQR